MIDLRDTLTKPTDAMRAAMARAEVGDDVYGEDPTVRALEERVAGLLGHEAALFTPTGSMANILAVGSLVEPGQEVLCESSAHIARAELGAHAAVGGLTMRTWTHPRGQVDLPAIRTMFAPEMGPFFVRIAAISVENTHNFAGGAVLPLADLRDLREFATGAGARVHLDGARLWNAHIATGVELAAYGRLFDTVSVCLSKGLGAPAGSLLVGSADAVATARVRRKRLGGGMRQVGILAAHPACTPSTTTSSASPTTTPTPSCSPRRAGSTRPPSTPTSSWFLGPTLRRTSLLPRRPASGSRPSAPRPSAWSPTSTSARPTRSRQPRCSLGCRPSVEAGRWANVHPAGQGEGCTTVLSDVEIANAATLRPIREVAAETLGIAERHLVPYGHVKAKVDLAYLASLAERPLGRLVLVTAMSPTPPGEGKTTTTVGLTDALHGSGVRTVACLREPSMGPVFGMKGGAAGGGYSQVMPMVDINLHFTGDFAAIAAANNLLAALIDNHVHHGNALDIDVRSVTWKRVLDMNDRALREVVVGLGGPLNGYPREDGFDIVVASELMAIFCLTESWSDLKRRIGDIVIGHSRAGEPVTARDLGAAGVMAAVLRDALAPNLVQTLEGAPAFVHGGPFANIAHGCSSVLATRAALRLADVVVTEAGFGADLGAEKFVDIKCRASGLRPDLAVVVATVRALKYHGGVALADLGEPDVGALEAGMANLRRHLDNVRGVHGIPCVVAVNRFADDTDVEVTKVVELVESEGVSAYVTTHFVDGGLGAQDLAKGVLRALDEPAPSTFSFTYADDLTLTAKVEAVATRLYAAGEVTWDAKARRQLVRIERDGYGALPVCVAKTQYSFSTDPKLLGAPTGHELRVREVRLSAGAGFVVVVCGDIMTMPGLPRDPSASRIDLADDGTILGLS